MYLYVFPLLILRNWGLRNFTTLANWLNVLFIVPRQINDSNIFLRRTLNNNNLTSLPENLFEELFRLRTLRLSDNSLICDCHLSWLARWLRRFPRLALYTRCFSPTQLKGQNVADLHDQEFKCSGECWAERGDGVACSWKWVRMNVWEVLRRWCQRVWR